jgi:magnesium transporter
MIKMNSILDIPIHELHLKDIKNPIHPSLYETTNEYQILIIRLPELWEGRANILSLRTPEAWENKGRYVSYSFLFTPSKIYYFDKKIASFELLNGGLSTLYHFLNEKIDNLMDDLDMAQDKIAFMEEGFFKDNSTIPMQRWHTLKKELSRSERVIIKALDTLQAFIAKINNQELHNEFNDLNEHLERSLRNTLSANGQLDDLYRYYNLRSNDRMNRSIYVLTIVSVIFLPLNLAVGFFGMNTGGLPFQNANNGTFYAFESMIAFAIVLVSAVLWKIKKG